ncbi:MAG TPA: diacylglycerol kinase family lipid kinase [Clostridiales bacterium]|jgi:YegS/Rv2252/BmrU family lipid kinase|nr:diacylglycerol kinase family lipid kinase [Clostridiales bacterium]
MKTVMLIINPVAGKRIAQTELFDMVNVFSRSGYLVTTAITQHRGHAVELAASAEGLGFQLVVCCGGDGTLHEVINGLLRSGSTLPIGYIPAGSANDFARTLDLPTSPVHAAFAIVRGKAYTIDVGRFNDDQYFSYIASFGAFTQASYRVPQDTKNNLGQFAYVLEGVRDIALIKPHPVKLKTENRSYRGNFVFCSVTNSTSVAGIVKLDPDIVDLRDGLFEVILVRMPRTPADLNRIVRGIASSNFNNRMFEFFKANDLEFQMEGDVDWTLDGERAEGTERVHIHNLPHSLTIYR